MTVPTISDLRVKRCVPCTSTTPALSDPAVSALLLNLPGWSLEGKAIARTFKFADYYQTIAFVNAIAFMSHREDHHPDLEVGYNRCKVTYCTHAINGLSENDFICAAKIEGLVAA